MGDGARLGWVPGGREWAPGTPPGIMPSICPPIPPGDTPTAPGGNLGKYRGKSGIMRSPPLPHDYTLKSFTLAEKHCFVFVL